MDRTHTRIGRYRPWFLAGAPLLMAGTLALFLAPHGAGELYLVAWLLLYYLATSIVMLSQTAWAGSLSNDYRERARIFGFVSGVGTLGSIMVMVTPFVLQNFIKDVDVGGVNAEGWLIAGLTPVLAILAALSPERVAPAPPRTPFRLVEYWKIVARPSVLRIIWADLLLALGPGSLSPMFLFFYHDVKGFPVAVATLALVAYSVGSLFGAPAWAEIARRIGKHRAVIIPATCWSLCQMYIFVMPDRSWTLFLLELFEGFFAAAYFGNIRALVADIADEIRLDFGKERTGLLYSLVSFTQKVGGALAITAAFTLLAWIGYNPKAGGHNAPAALNSLTVLYALLPSFFTMAGVAGLIGFPLTAAKHAEIRAALAAKDLESAEATAAADPGETPAVAAISA